MEQNHSVRLFICTVCFVTFLVSCHSLGGSFYRVEKGDTLWRVAHVHDVEIDEIRHANPQLDIDNLDVGSRIFLPSVHEVRQVPKQKLDTEQWIPKFFSTTSQNPKKKEIRQKVDDSGVYHFMWPYRGPIISTFGMRSQKMHNGIDIQIPINQTIKASYSGKVVYAGDQIEGYDQIVILLHNNHFFTIYAYLGEILVQKDQSVKAGDILAKPRSSQPSFFHFEIRYAKTALNPERYLSKGTVE